MPGLCFPSRSCRQGKAFMQGINEHIVALAFPQTCTFVFKSCTVSNVISNVAIKASGPDMQGCYKRKPLLGARSLAVCVLCTCSIYASAPPCMPVVLPVSAPWMLYLLPPTECSVQGICQVHHFELPPSHLRTKIVCMKATMPPKMGTSCNRAHSHQSQVV